jgi:FixJ family two-component response regulator
VKPEPEPPTVFVVHDDPDVCSSIRRLLRPAGWRVEMHSTPTALFNPHRPSGPCCLVLDIHAPDLSGLEFKRRLERKGLRVPIIFISDFGSISTAIQAMKEGAVDFLTRPFDPRTLLPAVRHALEQDARHLQRERTLDDLARRFASLTSRERDVCFAVTRGLLNKQVGAEFGISEKTIKVHRARVMRKMGARSLPELVRMADALRAALPPRALRA